MTHCWTIDLLLVDFSLLNSSTRDRPRDAQKPRCLTLFKGCQEIFSQKTRNA
ncbi:MULTISPECIES: hypothetical protein [unclassified Microcoleus]|uniref:hypothetical protein n=1 Tax=unclassified Microcoleus TaxID=2642155 RepID=UPI002FD5F608